MTAVAVTTALPPAAPRAVSGPAPAADTPESAFEAVMATLSAPTRTAREAAQTPSAADGAPAPGADDAAAFEEAEVLGEDVTVASDVGVTLAIPPAGAALDGAAPSEGDGNLTAGGKSSHSTALALARHPGKDLGATADQTGLAEEPEGRAAVDPAPTASARPNEASRIATLGAAPTSTPSATGESLRSTPEAKPPQDSSPPVTDLAAETPAPTASLARDGSRPDAASNLAAPAQASGAQPRSAANRSERTERTRATDEVGSGKGAAATAGAARAAHGRGAAADAATEITALPATDPEDSVARDDSAAPDILGSPEGTTNAQNSPAAGALTHAVRGSPETVASLAAQIVKKLEGRSTRFDLELDPAGLGRVDVRIDIGARGHISAAMSFETPQAASELRARSSELRQALEQAGFDLSGGLSFDVAGDRGQARQDHQGAHQQAFRGQAFRAALDTAGDAADAAVHGALRLRRGLTSSLDLRI